jgi:hypothetical protein
MGTQLTIFDLLDSLAACEATEVHVDLPTEEEQYHIPEEDIPFIRENLLIESVRSAFGVSRGGRDRQPSTESWEWIVAEDTGSPFSFRNCCLSVGVDPDELLDWLCWYRKRQ